MIRARAEAGLTQGALAERMGTKQSAVARLEGGGVSPTVETLRRYAKAVGKRLRVELVRGVGFQPTMGRVVVGWNPTLRGAFGRDGA